ncbi:M48 family metallopeptidase [bacterium]|nr:M48 family metallopeptidase [bacterium]
MPRLTVEGKSIDYQVEKTRRNRYVRLTVSARHGVRISAPIGTPDRELHAMVREKGGWILDRLEQFRREEAAQPKWRYHDGAQILLRGKWTPLEIRGWDRRSGKIRLTKQALRVDLPHEMCSDAVVVQDLFERWLRKWAQQDIPLRAEALARQMKLRYSHVGIRDQRSKWGSCSSTGRLSLNMRLMLTPVEVCDYVIIHELAHLKELNHSRRFWSIVERYCPDHDVHRKWLREHGWLLDFNTEDA